MESNTHRRLKPAASRRSQIEELCLSFSDARSSSELLDGVVRGAKQLFDADAAAVFLFQDGILMPTTWVGLQPQLVEQDGLPATSGLRAYLGRFMEPSKCHRFMHAPLLNRNGAVGELAVCSSRRDAASYSRDDHELLELLGRRAGTALERTETTERAEHRTGSLARIAKALVRETELRRVAATAVDLAVGEFEAGAAAVWLATPEEKSLVLLDASGFPQDVVDAMSNQDFDSPTFTARAAATSQIQIVESPEQAAELRLSRHIMENSGIQSQVEIPLVAHGHLVGVFSFARKTPTEWADGETALVGTMADLLASALLNARLFEESERRRLLAENLSSTLTTVNEELALANARMGELAELAQTRASELEATIENIADAVFVCDVDGKIVLIIEAGLQSTGRRSTDEPIYLGDYLSKARVRFSDGRSAPTDELAITRALRGEVVRGLQEIIYDSRSGRDRYIVVSAAPVRDRKGKLLGAVEVHGDITKLKELDQLKDQFITVAAHEIKTPVTAIKGFAQTLLRSKTAADLKEKTALETIVRQSDRIDALVRDFLEVSRMRNERTSLATQRLNLTQMVLQITQRMARTTARHNFRVYRADEAWVDGEPDRLQEVVMNLLDNAIRYSPQGGLVEIGVAREEDKVKVSVRDEGMGIPETRKANLFERFYRAHIGTSLDYGGLGVGLYISRETVRRHGGDMWFESQEGKGSAFFFTLPLAP